MWEQKGARGAAALLSFAVLCFLAANSNRGSHNVELYQSHDDRIDDPPSGWADAGSRSIHVDRSEDGSIIRVDVPSDARIRQVDDGYEIALPQGRNRAQFDDRYSVPRTDHLQEWHLDSKQQAERRLLKRFFASEVDPSSRTSGWSLVSDWMKDSGAGNNVLPVHVSESDAKIRNYGEDPLKPGGEQHSIGNTQKGPHLEVYVHHERSGKEHAKVRRIVRDLENLEKDSPQIRHSTDRQEEDIEPCDIGCQMSRIYGPIIGPGLAKYSDIDQHPDDLKAQKVPKCGIKCTLHSLYRVLSSYYKGESSSPSQDVKGPTNARHNALEVKREPGSASANVRVPKGAIVKSTSRGFEVIFPDKRYQRYREADQAQDRINAEMRAASGHWYHAPHWPSKKGPYPLDGPPSGRTIPHSIVDVYSPNTDPFYCLDRSDSRECGTDTWVHEHHHDYSLGWTDENGAVPTPPGDRNTQDHSRTSAHDHSGRGESLADSQQFRSSEREETQGYHRQNSDNRFRWSELEDQRQPSPARSMELLQKWKNAQELNDHARQKAHSTSFATDNQDPKPSSSSQATAIGKVHSSTSIKHISAVAAQVKAWLGAYDQHKPSLSQSRSDTQPTLHKDTALKQFAFAPQSSGNTAGESTWLSQYDGFVQGQDTGGKSTAFTTELEQVPPAIRELELEPKGYDKSAGRSQESSNLTQHERLQQRLANQVKERQQVLARMRLHSIASEKNHIAAELAGTGGRWLWRA